MKATTLNFGTHALGVAAAVVLLGAASTPALGQTNLVTDGGFENTSGACSLADWGYGGLYTTTVSPGADGTACAAANMTSEGNLYQDLPELIGGQMYQVSFWARATGLTSRLDYSLGLNFGHVTGLTSEFTHFSFLAMAGSSDQTLQLFLGNNSTIQSVDEVSVMTPPVSPPVTTTPEPSSMALLGTGLIGLVPMVRRRRK